MIRNIILVALGGAVGSALRYALSWRPTYWAALSLALRERCCNDRLAVANGSGCWFVWAFAAD